MRLIELSTIIPFFQQFSLLLYNQDLISFALKSVFIMVSSRARYIFSCFYGINHISEPVNMTFHEHTTILFITFFVLYLLLIPLLPLLRILRNFLYHFKNALQFRQNQIVTIYFFNFLLFLLFFRLLNFVLAWSQLILSINISL